VSPVVPHHIDPLWPFRLKPIKAARVSEISEATAASETPPEERVNFHIGNPVQDERLRSAYLRMVLGIDIQRDDLGEEATDQLLAELAWEPEDRSTIEFLRTLISKSGPYTPRGGFTRNNPHRITQELSRWLQQQETLTYDLGQVTGKREIILASGGIAETLRVLLHALSANLVEKAAHFFFLNADVEVDEDLFRGIRFERLPSDEQVALARLAEHFASVRERPAFLFVGCVLQEETRRALRQMSIDAPLLFIEANDEPNHRSLAREAKLVHRVIRILTPGIFSPKLRDLSTVFLLGNAAILGVFESMHFQLKGTPSASELELLGYLLDRREEWEGATATSIELPIDHQGEQFVAHSNVGISLAGHAARVERLVEHVTESRVERFVGRSLNIGGKVDIAVQHLQRRANAPGVEAFAHTDARTLVADLAANIESAAWRTALRDDLLQVFVRNHPEYLPSACVVVSGSSRTALGLLGFHCGIREVIIPDLSWSYEHCFPKVEAVPLASAYTLDADAILAAVRKKVEADPQWCRYGAVAVNNPHNATGRVFHEHDVSRLLVGLLEMNIVVIDDLSYQDVAPVEGLPRIKTVRQLAEGLVRAGRLTQEQAGNVVTVHSVSKTDCLAGARLAVVEIRHAELRRAFLRVLERIQPNIAAMLMTYLFYRNRPEVPRAYWQLRNRIFLERSEALLQACTQLPKERNTFAIRILPPTGSMYPLMVIDRLPSGLSLDWLASSLARRGVGLLPLGTFARTEAGFEAGRTTFRLTLGGVDGAEVLLSKTRHLLIDLNRLIGEEEAHYNRKPLSFRVLPGRSSRSIELARTWEGVAKQILGHAENHASMHRLMPLPPLDSHQFQQDFLECYGPERLQAFRTRLLERVFISDELIRQALNENSDWLEKRLDREFMKDSLPRRLQAFRLRSYDRTVHPTQMYSLQAELALDAIVTSLIYSKTVTPSLIKKAGQELWQEYLGRNVSINSQQEADEILLDLATLITGEEYAEQLTDASLPSFLSFWSDWDGSNRPSGQGHRLVASVVMGNVQRMTGILNLLRQADPHIPVSPELISELDRLPQRNQRFNTLLTDITLLTHQLEQRYRGILPFSIDTTSLQRLATRWHLRRDPARILWQHNDRYEQKMFDLRQQRRGMLEYYCSMNKQLRKQLHALIPAIISNRSSEHLLRQVVGYRDILQRTVITPRIHQGMVTARDQFAIDTTVYNLYEINGIAGKYGNPGVALALQVSFSSRPEALISLDRKMHIQAEQMRREHPSVELPSIWLIPLLEEVDSVRNIRPYLDRLWDYATQSRQTAQTEQDRFAEIIPEVFIAGSDLSQQISQAAGALLYLKAKYDMQTWLAEHGVAEAIRIKMGSGEPMQRQGGYYSHVAGRLAFLNSEDSRRRFATHLPAAARKGTAYAVTPLQGIFLAGDLRTFQSNLSEQLRYMPARDFVSLLYHVRESQRDHRADLIRAAESIAGSRLSAQSRSVQELERLTVGTNEALYEGFLAELTDNFRHILYGREEDVLGIHIISYFIARSIPQLRDRPTSRSAPDTGAERGQQILANIAKIIPLAKQGSLLRAIAHNQAQTVVLGVNQLTTGLFRALERFTQKTFVEAERESMLAEHLLPHLPVYEILSSLRIYQDGGGEFLKRVETAFPAGNSAFAALREDNNALQRYLPLFQQELLRRHGLNVTDFFTNGVFIPELLPTLRPDLAVLLQKNLFNSDIDLLLEHVTGSIEDAWRTEVAQLLQLPNHIRHWRSIIWDGMGESVHQRVQSFSELATALYSFSAARAYGGAPAATHLTKLSPALAGFFRTARSDDEMRSFLVEAIEYLSSFTDGNIEVPVSIIRAMNDVERIAQIEESALPPEKQDVIRTCLLQIARLAGENS